MTALRGLVESSEALLLDFDGPVCRLFAHYTARKASRHLARFLTNQNIEVPPDLADGPNPMQLLLWVADHAPHLTAAADDALRAAESQAAETAEPTPHADDAVRAATRARRAVAVASNNSEPAITGYLQAHGLAAQVAAIAARPHGEPHKMKPDPDTVTRAVNALGASPDRCLFVGDSRSDIEVALKTGVRPIGYAKTPERGRRLAEAGAEDVIDDMADLADALDLL